MVDIEINPKDKEIEVSETWDLDSLFGTVIRFWKSITGKSQTPTPTEDSNDVP